MDFAPEWHAMVREAELAAELLGSGVTSLGRANHAQRGLYTKAFFGLSIGLERIAKLAIIADFALTNKGRFPENEKLRKIGHEVDGLLDHCEQLSSKWRKGLDYSERPKLAIHNDIVKTLAEFAKLSRYYNLDFLTGGRASNLPEPIGAWWQRVGAAILRQHYTQRQRKIDESQSKLSDGQRLNGSSP